MPQFNEDQQLLARLANPQERGEAWREFLNRYSDLFYSILLRRLGPHRQDPDLVREGYLYIAERILARLPQPGELRHKLSTWLYTVCGNMAVDFLRERFGRVEVPESVRSLGSEAVEVYSLLYIKQLAPLQAFEHYRSRHQGDDGGFWDMATELRAIHAEGRSRAAISHETREISLDAAEEDHAPLLDRLADAFTPLNGLIAAEDDAARQRLLGLLQAAVDALGEPQRSLIIGRFISGRKPGDLSGEFNLSPEQVSREIYRGLGRLRKLLEILSEGTSINDAGRTGRIPR